MDFLYLRYIIFVFKPELDHTLGAWFVQPTSQARVAIGLSAKFKFAERLKERLQEKHKRNGYRYLFTVSQRERAVLVVVNGPRVMK